MSQVVIKQGKILGNVCKDIRNGDFFSFQGIPYAKPPEGKLRFKAPEPPESWSEIRDCTTEGDECYSRHVMHRQKVGSENCLFLNVYTPKLPKKADYSPLLPVMFWIHGGAFTHGSSKSEVYGPEFLLPQKIVLVTINYRLGVLGFLNFEDPTVGIPGNAGLKDIIMALKWVQENIKQFSGNPNNVTVFGESAGGAIAHYLMLSPKSKGLFHKIIAQSGSAINPWAMGRKNSIELAKALNLNTRNEKIIADVLQNLSLEELHDASEKLYDPLNVNTVRPFGPVIERFSENAFISDHPLNILKSGNYIKVPLIMGYTTREGMLMRILQRRKFRIITDFQQAIPHWMKLQPNSDISKLVANKIKEFYYGEKEPSIEDIDTYYKLQTDTVFLREIYQCTKYHAITSPKPVYLYRMSIETDLNINKIYNGINDPGACHADDVGYLFKTIGTPKILPESPEDIGIQRFTKLWANFAKNGDPNPTEEDPLIKINWKAVTPEEVNFLDIGQDLRVGVNPNSSRMAFWDNILRINPICKL